MGIGVRQYLILTLLPSITSSLGWALMSLSLLAEKLLAPQPVLTLDGRRIEVAGNMGCPAYAFAEDQNGAEGICLFRTEFPLLGCDLASIENEHLATYDDNLPPYRYSDARCRVRQEPEINAYRRGSQSTLRHARIPPSPGMTEMLMVQLCALMCASAGYDLRMMFPMVAAL
jgi:phosphotransferase system enzyme I (PtsI)